MDCSLPVKTFLRKKIGRYRLPTRYLSYWILHAGSDGIKGGELSKRQGCFFTGGRSVQSGTTR